MTPEQRQQIVRNTYYQIEDAINNAPISEEAKIALRANVKLDDESVANGFKNIYEQLNKQEELEDKHPLSLKTPTDKDVNQEEFVSVGDTFAEHKDELGVEGTEFEDYSEKLLENKDAVAEAAESILRYNDAIKSLDSSYDN
jgi:hypothetical protein